MFMQHTWSNDVRGNMMSVCAFRSRSLVGIFTATTWGKFWLELPWCSSIYAQRLIVQRCKPHFRITADSVKISEGKEQGLCGIFKADHQTNPSGLQV
jgi:hypothetical protein